MRKLSSQVRSDANKTHFHMKGFCTWTRFETKAEGNSEMAYSLDIFIVVLQEHFVYGIKALSNDFSTELT